MKKNILGILVVNILISLSAHASEIDREVYKYKYCMWQERAPVGSEATGMAFFHIKETSDECKVGDRELYCKDKESFDLALVAAEKSYYSHDVGIREVNFFRGIVGAGIIGEARDKAVEASNDGCVGP